MAGALSASLRTAASGLLANQRALDAVANNVSNVNTPGYSRKLVNFETRALAGAGAGVDLGPLTRTIDEGLIKTIRLEREALGALTAQSDLHGRIQDLFGTPENNTSLSHGLADLQNALKSLALAPHNSIEQREVVRQAEDITLRLRQTGSTIQNLRAETDARIGRTLDEINGLVTSVAELTATVVRENALGKSTADVEDQRDLALDRLAGLIDIRVFPRGGGDIAVVTASGRTLIDGPPVTLTHRPAAGVDAASSYAGGGLDAITLGDGATARDITNDIRGGSLAGLIEMRDRILPNLQSTLDTLAVGLRDSVNQVHNAGLSFPGLTTLNGTRQFTEPATQTIGFSAAEDTRLILFDTAGNEARSTSVRTLIGGASTTIDGLTAQIDGWLGADGSASMVDGALQIRIIGTGLALGLRDEAQGAPGSAPLDARLAFDADADGQTDEIGSGFSSFFGLNDLFVDIAPTTAQASAVVAAGFGASAATLTFHNAGGAMGAPVAVGAGDSLETIAAKITAATGLAARIVPDGGGVRLRVTADDGAAFTVTQDPGAGDTLLDDLGFGPAASGAANRLTVRADITAQPSLLSRGAVQWDPARGPAGRYHTGVGDDTTVHALAAVFETRLDFATAGRLGAVETTLSGYATTLLGDTATLASRHAGQTSERQGLVDTLQGKSDGLRGVNLDEEMADLMLYEQAYSASARVFSVVQDMFDALERMLG